MIRGSRLLLSFFLLVSACGFSYKEISLSQEADQNHEDTLIVFLSRTKNTKVLTEIIHDQVGGTLIELELVNPYPEVYQAIVRQIVRENESGFLPPLKTRIENMDQIDVVFIGFPTWAMQLPPHMKSFLNQYDLGGKTVIPFNTNAGYGVGSSFETVENLCPNRRILDGYSTTGGIERDGILFVMEGEKEIEVRMEVRKWLESINILQPQIRKPK